MIVRITGFVFVTFALVACSGSSTGSADLFGDGGTAKNGDNGGKSPFSGGTNPPAANDGANTNTNQTNASTCKLQNETLGTGACDQCIGKSCCAEVKACDGNQECVALLSCANQCAGDDACVQDCVNQYPNGVNPVKTLAGCMKQSCAGACQ
jgi:hypothetical protein